MAGLLLTLDQFLGRLPDGRTLEVDEQDRISLLLADVSALARNRRPLIDEWLASGELERAWVTAVLFRVAQRVVDSVGMGGLVVRSETHPEHAYELSEQALVGLDMTDQEIRDLTPVTLRRRPRAFSVTPG